MESMTTLGDREVVRGHIFHSSCSGEDEESTEVKIALVASQCPDVDQETILEILLDSQGSVARTTEKLSYNQTAPRVMNEHQKCVRPKAQQSSLKKFAQVSQHTAQKSSKKIVSKKGQTLHLYSPEDVAAHTPCSIIHNFLPSAQADALLEELLLEAPSFARESFNLFDQVVTSPHTTCFYVNDWDEATRQKTDYVYNGSKIRDVRKTPKQMQKVSGVVKAAVNSEIAKRIDSHYPNKKKLRYQSSKDWEPNTAFVNSYNGGKESVGYHSDQLTYLGPRPVIGSLSLGVAREFRVRRVSVSPDPASDPITLGNTHPEGQLSIHLPHNSLLVMHAEMQEEWKHSIAPAKTIEPHPLAGERRINVTYRCYRESLHPKNTPKCNCGISTVLRCVQRKQENVGRYMWMCHAGYTPGQKGCSFFKWAEFDDDGEPLWSSSNLPLRVS